MNIHAPVAEAASQSHAHHASGRVSVPLDLLRKEQELKALCFTIDAYGVVSEALWLDHNHPTAPDKFAVILGEGQTFVARDSAGKNGCLYQKMSGGARVRRATVGQIQSATGKKFPVLCRPDDSESNVLAHVHTGMPNGSRVNADIEPLFSGIGGSASKVAWGGSEVLVEVKEGESLLIFYPTGEVACVHHEGFANLAFAGHRVQMLVPDEALAERLAYISQQFAGVENIVDEKKRATTIDRWFHEYASMILLTEPYPDFREDIIKAIGHAAKHYKNGVLGGGVREHLKRALRAVGDLASHWWLEDSGKPGFSLIDHLGATERKGTPSDRAARLAARRARDAATRAGMRGTSSGGGGNKQQKSGGKKK